MHKWIISPIAHWISKLTGGRKEKAERQKSELKAALPWLIPGGIIFLLFTLGPLVYQVGVSMTDFNSISIKDGFNGGIWREVWGGRTCQIKAVVHNFPFRDKTVHYVGLSSYQPVFKFISDQQILFTNLFWTVSSVALQTLLGLGVSLIVWQRGIRFKQGWQALFILPWAIPEMIGALMWVNVFAPETGWLALAVQKFGPGMPLAFFIGWTNDPNLWFLVLLISGVWYGFPFMMLAASAGLKMIPNECFDSAQMDGAGGLQLFRYVTWPLLNPLLIPTVIIRGIFAFNQFYLFQAFRVSYGTLATLSYNFFNPSGFNLNGQFAISAVINIIAIMILIVFVVIFIRWSHASQGVGYA
jgi:ABC-type sugar transport system permease subunit